MKVTIPITTQHIWKANMTSTTCCAVARAIQDAIPEAREVNIGVWDGNFTDPEYMGIVMFKIPEPIALFIRRMIRTPRILRPLFFRKRSFELDIPDWFSHEEKVKPRLRFSLLARILARAELLGLPGILRNRASGRPDAALSRSAPSDQYACSERPPSSG
jgi:hypothetical protein